MKGINYGSKKKPLLGYWFRNPPPVKVEITNPVVLQRELDDDYDPVLRELEQAWRPIGHVDQDKKLGIGDRYEGPNPKDAEIVKTPPEEKKQRIDKKDIGVDKKDIVQIEKEKKEKARIKKQIKDEHLKKIGVKQDDKKKEKPKKEDLNSDVADVMKQGKKKKKQQP